MPQTCSILQPDTLKKYFFDIFKECYLFYPKVEVTDKCIRITSFLDNKQIKVVQKKTYFSDDVVLSLAVARWKVLYLSKLRNMSKQDVINMLDFSERVIDIHKDIRVQLTDEDGELKFIDPIIIRKTAEVVIRTALDSINYIQYTISPVTINFSKFVIIETNIDFSIGQHQDKTKIRVMI